ncbi:polyketide synthase, partial [Actinomadura soli]
YWLATTPTTDATHLGLTPVNHPLLGGMTRLADGDGLLLSGRLSARTHPWLAQHLIAGSALLPGSALVDLAIAAGDRAGLGVLRELVLAKPLHLPDEGIRVQLTVGTPDDSGECSVTIHSHRDTAADGPPGDEGEWTLHASGVLSNADRPGPVEQGVWPPPGARPLAHEGLYERLTDLGYDYGSAFRGLQAVWESGTDLYAEVALPEELHEQAAEYGIHPALLDAALHALLLDAADTPDELRLPFSYDGVALHAWGATRLRVHLSTKNNSVALTATDPTGQPVLSVDSVTMRSVTADRITTRAAAPDGLYRLVWQPIQTTDSTPAGRWAVLGSQVAGLTAVPYQDLDALDAALAAGDPAPNVLVLPYRTADEQLDAAAATRNAVREMLETVQRALADERLGAATFLLLTNSAVGVMPGEDVEDLPAAAVHGLMRTAASEHPGRFALLDIHGDHPAGAIDTAAATALSHQLPVALRDATLYGPHLTRTPSPHHT